MLKFVIRPISARIFYSIVYIIIRIFTKLSKLRCNAIKQYFHFKKLEYGSINSDTLSSLLMT